MDTTGKSDAAAGEPATRRLRTLEEKLSILAEASRARRLSRRGGAQA